MARAPHHPFGDMQRPPRTDQQVADDERRNKEQTDRLEAAAVPAVNQTSDPDGEPTSSVAQAAGEIDDQGMDDLDRLLLNRRKRARAVLPLDTAPTDNASTTLVVPAQLIVRDVPDNLPDDARAVLEARNFRAPAQGEPSLACPELEGRFTVYTHTGGAGDGNRTQRNDDMRAAVRSLDEDLVNAKVKASPTLVTALQKVIVKAAIGPAPTTVDSSDPSTLEAFREAGFHVPTGEVVVAVIDTGIVNVLRADGWLNEVPGGPGRIDPLDAFPPPGNGKLDFAAGHGTFAAGIVRMVDPEAEIRVYRALDSDGFADEITVACAMIRAVKEGAQVINLSFGMQTIDGRPSVALEQALAVIDEITDEQTRPVIVAAAGNYGNEEKVWPAAFSDKRPAAAGFSDDKVVSVAALAKHNNDYVGADWSTRGDWVTCSCMGSGIVSTFVPGDEDPEFADLRPNNPPPDHYPLGDTGDSWAVWSGTSFAAPQVAGAIARLCREGPGAPLTPLQARDHLLLQPPAAPLPGFPGFGKAMVLLPGT